MTLLKFNERNYKKKTERKERKKTRTHTSLMFVRRGAAERTASATQFPGEKREKDRVPDLETRRRARGCSATNGDGSDGVSDDKAQEASQHTAAATKKSASRSSRTCCLRRTLFTLTEYTARRRYSLASSSRPSSALAYTLSRHTQLG